MMTDRGTRIAVAFAREAARPSSSPLCSACVDVLAVTAAGITIMGGDHDGPIGVSNQSVSELEDLQFTVGQGPCRDAFQSGRPVHAPRFDTSRSTSWPSFVALARATDIAAVFAYPLVSNGANIGVLTLYQRHEGDLSSVQHLDSLSIATVLTETVLSLQDDAPPGTLASSLEASVAYRAEIYQASGMVAIQLEISSADALVRLRAYAFANDTSVAIVAADIVARRLRLTDDRENPEREV
jgi:hypothetical protein